MLVCIDQSIRKPFGSFRCIVFFIFFHQFPNSNYFELLKCTDDVFHSEVKCADSSETFQEFVRTIFDDIINVACGDYVEFSDKCQQLPILSLPVQRKNQKRPKSILIPLIEIWDQSASTKTN